MRIACPYCGERDHSEFSYLGDAGVARMPLGASAEGVAAPEDGAFAAVYLRSNPAGEHREHWYHAAGCRSWLIVTRDTRTHAISAIVRADGAQADAEQTT